MTIEQLIVIGLLLFWAFIISEQGELSCKRRHKRYRKQQYLYCPKCKELLQALPTRRK